MARSGPRDPRRGSDPLRNRQGQPRGGGPSRGAPDPWRDDSAMYDGRGAWGDSAQYSEQYSAYGPAQYGGGPQYDDGPRYDARGNWEQSAGWPADGQSVWMPAAAPAGPAGPAFAGALRADDVAAQGRKSWKRRLGLTRDQWQLSVLSNWPDVTRLMALALAIGGLVGLILFAMRLQPIGDSSVGSGRLAVNGGPGVNGTPTLSVYGPGGVVWIPPALPTATAQPTTAAVQFTAAPKNVTACQPVTITLDNTKGSAKVDYTINPASSSTGAWTSVPSQGSVPAAATDQVKLTPPDKCDTSTNAPLLIATVAWSISSTTTSANGTIDITYTASNTGGQPTATPTKPVATPTDTATPTGTATPTSTTAPVHVP